jgi:hypothetical protein
VATAAATAVDRAGLCSRHAAGAVIAVDGVLRG